jgi:hypothetical protein
VLGGILILIWQIIVKIFTQPTKKTYMSAAESAASDEYILGIRKKSWPRILSLVAISTAENSLRCCQQLTRGFCSDALDACIMASGEEDTAKLSAFRDER